MNIEKSLIESVQDIFESHKIFKKTADEQDYNEYGLVPGTQIYCVEGFLDHNKYHGLLHIPPMAPDGYVYHEIDKLKTQLKSVTSAN